MSVNASRNMKYVANDLPDEAANKESRPSNPSPSGQPQVLVHREPLSRRNLRRFGQHHKPHEIEVPAVITLLRRRKILQESLLGRRDVNYIAAGKEPSALMASREPVNAFTVCSISSSVWAAERMKNLAPMVDIPC